MLDLAPMVWLTMTWLLAANNAGPTHPEREASEASVAALSRPDLQDEITLKTGEQLRGKVIERTLDSILFEHPVLGRLDLALSDLREVSMRAHRVPETKAPANIADDAASDAPSGEVKVIGPLAAQGPQAPPAPSTEPEPAEWKYQLELGFNGTEGNSEDLNVRAAIRAGRETPDNTTRYDATYKLATSSGERRENRLTAGVNSRWPLNGSPFNTFVEGRYDYAEFQSFEHRLTGGAGVGLELLNIDRVNDDGKTWNYLDLSLRSGAGVRKEYGSSTEDLEPEGIFGGDLIWRPSERQTLAATSTFYPNLVDSTDYRIVTAADWSWKIDELDGISLKLGVAHEHHSIVDDGVDHDDISVYATLLIDF